MKFIRFSEHQFVFSRKTTAACSFRILRDQIILKYRCISQAVMARWNVRSSPSRVAAAWSMEASPDSARARFEAARRAASL
tara:strand:+ start:444 stop:686 length:243 start_codon:yes stop_codon:yes gene_type:complete